MEEEIHPLEKASGPVNAECVHDYKNDLRNINCNVCEKKKVREISVGRGLETVIKCRSCGHEYVRRGE